MKLFLILMCMAFSICTCYASETRDTKYDRIIENNRTKAYVTETNMQGRGHFAKFKARVFYSLPLADKKYERHKKRIEAENSYIY